MNLEELRLQIDRIDTELCILLAERFAVTQKVGEYKALHGLPATDPKREEKQFIKIAQLATQHQLNPHFAAKFLRLIIDEVVKNHQAIASR